MTRTLKRGGFRQRKKFFNKNNKEEENEYNDENEANDDNDNDIDDNDDMDDLDDDDDDYIRKGKTNELVSFLFLYYFFLLYPHSVII